MKNKLSVVLVALAFTLVGCANKKAPAPAEQSVVATEQGPKCKGKKCHHRHHHGKFGVEKAEQDVAK